MEGIELVDMCSLQNPQYVDFDKMKASGVRGVYLKSSQYSGSADATFDIGVDRAMKAGLACGAYHFAFCGSNPAVQMDFFHRMSSGLGKRPGELPPMIDWEYAVNGLDGQPLVKSKTVDWALEALDAAKALWYPDSDRLPILYTFPYFAEQRQPWLGNATRLAEYPLALAYYPTILSVPKPWTVATIHQYAGDGGRVPGVSVACDRDRFLGTEEQFQAFLGYREPTGVKLVPDEAETGSGGIIHVGSYPQ